MKIINKVLGVLMITGLFAVCSPMSVEAASGKIIFNDPTTPAGEEVDITIEVVSYDDEVSSFNIEIEYDSEIIQFISSEFSQSVDGKLIFNSEESGLELKDTMVFRALKNETTIITISTQEVLNEGGEVFTMREGTSEIKIVGGVEVEPTEIEEEIVNERVIVQVQGVDYYITSDFLESKLPLGYVMTEMELEGELHTVALGELSDIVLVYLEAVESLEEEGTQGSFFMYDTDTAAYRPYVQVKVSDSAYIAFLNEDYPEEMPLRYIPTTMTADGYEFVAWEDADRKGYYIVYVINTSGDKMLYSYDLIDQSYQRFVLEEEAANPNKVENESLQELIDFIAANLLVSLFILALLLGFSLVLVVVFGIKLFNRNKELDDIYTDAGILNRDNDNDYDDDYEDDYDDDNDDDSYEHETSQRGGMNDFDSQNIESNNYMDLNMIDDGLTQEFNVNVEEKYFSENGFINFENKREVNTAIDRNEEYAQESDLLDDFDDEYQQDIRKKENKSRFGFRKKSTESDDDNDGFEFIDL